MVGKLTVPDDEHIELYQAKVRAIFQEIIDKQPAYMIHMGALLTALIGETAHMVAFLADGNKEHAARNLEAISKEIPRMTKDYIQRYEDLKLAEISNPQGGPN